MSGPQRFALDEDSDEEERRIAPSPPPARPQELDLDLAEGSSGAVDEAEQSAVERVRLAWAQQSLSPALLPYPYVALDTLLGQMEQQQSILDSLTPASEEEHLRLNMVALDLERARWTVRALLRRRLDILELHSTHYLAQGSSGMSQSEWAFLQQYEKIRKNHFQATVLDGLPQQMRGLIDEAENSAGSMVTQPDLDSPVFIRCKQDCGPLRLPDGASAQLEQDSIHLLRYRSVQHLVLAGKVQLV